MVWIRVCRILERSMNCSDARRTIWLARVPSSTCMKLQSHSCEWTFKKETWKHLSKPLIRVKGKREGKHTQLFFQQQQLLWRNPKERLGFCLCGKGTPHLQQNSSVWRKTRRSSCTEVSEYTALMTLRLAGPSAGPQNVLHSNIILNLWIVRREPTIGILTV